MREKILSLAKGNFIYMTPELVLPEEPLTLSVVSGERLVFFSKKCQGKQAQRVWGSRRCTY